MLGREAGPRGDPLRERGRGVRADQPVAELVEEPHAELGGGGGDRLEGIPGAGARP